MSAVVTHYSQLGEQTAILQWAAKQRQAGSFVDLGAYDGATYSNTAALADMGWPGICVDAAPDASQACSERYADRDDVHVLLAVFLAPDYTGPVTVHWSPGEMYTAIERSRRGEVEIIEIAATPLDLRWFAREIRLLPRPVFCSIDLEGASLHALDWLLDHDEMDCVCVEANNPDDRETVRQRLAGWTELPLPGNHVNLLFAR